MPLFTAELAEFWRSDGLEYIADVLDQDVPTKSSDCGFAHAIQGKLRSLDSNSDLHAALSRHLKRRRHDGKSIYDPSKADILTKATGIFVPTQHGAHDYASALRGLDYLDAMEINRLQTLTAARANTSVFKSHDHRSKLIEELHETARNSYMAFYLGFRAAVRCVTPGIGRTG